MLDIKFVRQNLKDVKKKLATKGQFKFDLEKVLELDEKRRDILIRVETLRTESNKIARQGKRTERAIEIKRMLKDLEPQLAEAEENFKVEAVKLPNFPFNDVPIGKDESENKVIKNVGKVQLKKGKDHVEIAKNLDIIDIERASKVSGSRFYYLKNQAVELEFALILYALEIIKKEGFRAMIPPILINKDSAWGSGHFESINDDAYHMKEDEMVAIGTSEQSILPYYAEETLTDLPQRFVAFSTCLRREAGSYGQDTRGIFRTHQFDKLEMFSFSSPEDSPKEHDLIVKLEEKIVAGLGLPYRLVSVCTGDLSLPSVKTIDLEVYLPGQEKYCETHSSSNCTDFQARRLNIKYRDGNKTGYVHTLNGTAVAIGRMLIAILENGQQSDGSIKIPGALQKHLSFKEIKK